MKRKPLGKLLYNIRRPNRVKKRRIGLRRIIYDYNLYKKAICREGSFDSKFTKAILVEALSLVIVFIVK